jgi:DNA-binding NtrC family response regulator
MTATQPRLLVVDDERAIAEGLSAILSDAGYSVGVASDGKRALEMLSQESFGVVLADLNLPHLDGLGLLTALRERGVATECIIITGTGSVETAVQAMHAGAYDYIEKPLDAQKLVRLRALIAKALDKYNVQQSNREMTQKLEGLVRFGGIIGQSEAMHRVYSVIAAVAPTNASVLISGESGTGKELVARALHERSERSAGPFFALNCAALPRDILENELFGHEKGAFTGSTNEKAGAFELASGGTLFLDEIAEMPPEIQVKLLRALESRAIRRLGGRKEIEVDIRVVAATNRDVQLAIGDGTLREDLYYRLAVVELALPPLREREGDVKLLADEFLTRFSRANGKRLAGFDDDALAWIHAYPWPGNVRELKNAVERAVILAHGDRVSKADVVPLHLRAESTNTVSIDVGTPLAVARRALVLRTLASTGGEKVRAGTLLGMSVAEVNAELESLLSDGAASRGAKSNGKKNDATAKSSARKTVRKK